MKKITYFFIPVIIIGAFGLVFLSNQDSEKTATDRKKPLVSSMTRSVELPDKVTFAGEEITLDRYDIRERYDREINSFTYLHSTTLLLIKRANRLFPIIEPILKANGLPDDLKYLAVIESNLSEKAYSPAKAAGLWQFMPSTAKQFGMEVTPEVDERYSIGKSTEAACKYLKSAYNKYGSWSNASMSYNAGMGRITGEAEKQLVEDGLDLWVVEETSRYYFRMLAIKSIFENPAQYGFVISPNQLYKPIEFNEVTVNESIDDLAQFAVDNGVTYAQLKDFNQWLRGRKLTISPKKPQTYTILIPKKESLYYKKGEQVKVHNKKWVTQD